MAYTNLLHLRKIALLLFVIAVSSCTSWDAVKFPKSNPSIAEFVQQDDRFSLLNEAMFKAGLSDFFKQTDGLTLFAPDDAAFHSSGIFSLTNFRPEDLRNILLYHTIRRRIPYAVIPATDSVGSAMMSNLYLSSNSNGRFINGLQIRQRDIMCSNGYVHIPDKVLIPPSRNLISIAMQDTTISFMLSAINRIGMLSQLGNKGKYTVIFPTNLAFRDAGYPDVEAIDLTVLERIVKTHILNTNYFASDFAPGTYVQNLHGSTLLLNPYGQTVSIQLINGTSPEILVQDGDIIATNGVGHTIHILLN